MQSILIIKTTLSEIINWNNECQLCLCCCFFNSNFSFLNTSQIQMYSCPLLTWVRDLLPLGVRLLPLIRRVPLIGIRSLPLVRGVCHSSFTHLSSVIKKQTSTDISSNQFFVLMWLRCHFCKYLGFHSVSWACCVVRLRRPSDVRQCQVVPGCQWGTGWPREDKGYHQGGLLMSLFIIDNS